MTVRPTHFPGGLSNTIPGDPLYMFPYLDPTQFHIFFNDFDVHVSADYTVTISSTTGTNKAATGNGGWLVLSTLSATDNDLTSLQGKGNSGATTLEPWTWDATKYFFIKSRFKLGTATDIDFFIGLAVTDTSPIDAASAIGFLKADDAATVAVVLTDASTTTSQVLGTMVADTFVTAALAYIPGVGVQCFLNQALVGTITTLTNVPDSGTLAVTMCVMNGTTAATVATIDYLLIAQER